MILLDRAAGIDLGTTNSEIAILAPSERETFVYTDRFGRRTVPSAVAWDSKANEVVVGRAARARRGKSPGPIESIKRRMGDPTKLEVGPFSLDPAEISAKILGELARLMKAQLAEKASDGVELSVRRAVITVPAYFDAPQVEATRRAGELAGLEVLGILQEPTAAAIHHAFHRKITNANFLVYDLGGGTFDVSILRSVGGEYQVLAIDGDNYLGGDDFDRRWAEKLRERLAAKGYALDLDVRGNADDRDRFERLVHVAQEAKESLSSSEVVAIAKQDVFQDQGGEPVSIEIDLGRAEYEAGIADLVEKTIACAHRALAESKSRANVDLGDIDHVVLVGGSTRVPLVRRRVIEALASHAKSKEPLSDEVDTIVALGAAIHAAQLGGTRIEHDATRVRFTPPLVTSKDKTRVAVVVEAPRVADAVEVRQGEVVLASGGLGEGASARLEVSPSGDRDAELELVVKNAGATVGSVPFGLYRGEIRPRATALSRASVIAKDLGVEVVRAGRRERYVLLPKGTGLPAEVKHTFFTADQSGAVVIRLLQGRAPIKTLGLSVGRDLAIGSPVEVELTCDDTMRVEARALVGGQELWATATPTKAERFDDDESVETLLAAAESAKKTLWGTTGEAFRREAEPLAAAIREVWRTDPAKLSALAGRLSLLIDEYAGDPTDPLSPPRTMFEAELDALRRVVFRNASGILGLDQSTWDARVRELEERALEAWSAADATRWRRACNEVQALYETAIQEEFSNRKLDDPAYIAMRVASVSRWRKSLENTLADFVTSSTEAVRAIQEAERDRLLLILAERVAPVLDRIANGELSDPTETRRSVEQCAAELERVEAQTERLPSLGLVTERGNGA